jgi:hypothetical protein
MQEIRRTTDKSEMVQPAPSGGGFTKAQADEASELVVDGTSFEDPGTDHCVFKLVRKDGTVVAVSRVEGY